MSDNQNLFTESSNKSKDIKAKSLIRNDLPVLRDAVSQKLVKTFNAENALEMYEFMQQFDHIEAFEKIIEFIKEHTLPIKNPRSTFCSVKMNFK